jgi:hypothetical protein
MSSILDIDLDFLTVLDGEIEGRVEEKTVQSIVL